NNALGEFRLLTLLGRHARVDGIGLTELLRLSRTAFALNPDTIDNVTIPYTVGVAGRALGHDGAVDAATGEFGLGGEGGERVAGVHGPRVPTGGDTRVGASVSDR
ncbi:MAG: hypothetical protein ACKOOG_03905, partial [Actinomycetota bacterium]